MTGRPGVLHLHTVFTNCRSYGVHACAQLSVRPPGRRRILGLGGVRGKDRLRRRRFQTVPSRSLMREVLQHRLGAEEAEEACEGARARRQRALVAVYQTRAVPAAIADAMDRGEVIGLRGALGGEGVGHRAHEFVGDCLMIAAGRSWRLRY
jgi:hypothetical protein